jgi:alpha-beta hydrolase superfamily lysophospholipase
MEVHRMESVMVNQQVETTWQAPDGTRLYTQECRPVGETKAVVVLVHGLGEHCGRYSHVIEFFNRQGYAFITYDLHGHGRSEGTRGHTSYDQSADVIHHFLGEAAARFPGKPIFLYGHSLGGALVLYYGFTHHPSIKGIVATSPGLIPAGEISPAKLTLAKIMSRVYPSLVLDNGLDVTGLSHVPAVAERYQSDPLVHKKISARLGWDLINKGQWMLQQKSFPVPLLVLQGTGDRLVNPEGARRLSKILDKNTTFHFYDGLYHELHNEANNQEVLARIQGWMESLL